MVSKKRTRKDTKLESEGAEFMVLADNNVRAKRALLMQSLHERPTEQKFNLVQEILYSIIFNIKLYFSKC